jgi:cation transport protein ChaC
VPVGEAATRPVLRPVGAAGEAAPTGSKPALSRAGIDARHPTARPLEDDPYPGLPEEALWPQWNKVLAQRDDPKGLWILAYGSLIWKPEVLPVKSVVGRIHGYHRKFCLWQWRSRGHPEQPCLMMALDRGGACVAVAQWFEDDALASLAFPIWRREMRGGGYVARWVQVHTVDGPVRTLAFVANRRGPRYIHSMEDNERAAIIANGCGPRGACADYLLNTVEALQSLGIHDTGLWSLQQRVAQALRS